LKFKTKQIKKNTDNLARVNYERFQINGGTKLEFWTKLGAQLYPYTQDRKDNVDLRSNKIIIG
jgi:hypothetical protein